MGVNLFQAETDNYELPRIGAENGSNWRGDIWWYGRNVVSLQRQKETLQTIPGIGQTKWPIRMDEIILTTEKKMRESYALGRVLAETQLSRIREF